MYKELSPGIFQYQFPEKLAKECVKSLEKVPENTWQESLIGAGKKAGLRSSKDFNLDLVLPDISSNIRNIFYESVKHYVDYFKTSVVQDEGLQALKYEPHEEYGYHVDGDWQMYRTVSALIYLNPHKYEGGSTHFKYFDLSVKPESPAIVLFPSNYLYLHAATPVIKGRKYVIASWLSDRPKELMQSGHGHGGCSCSQ
jgi:hypothetical protein